MGIATAVTLHEYNIGHEIQLQEALAQESPGAVFLTSGESLTASSYASSVRLITANTAGAAEQISVIQRVCPEVPSVFFGSSEVFGYRENPGDIVDETALTNPSNPYGVSKAAMSQLIHLYREEFGLPIFEIVLFPHESEFRDPRFVIPKIVNSFAKFKNNPSAPPVEFGDIESTRDWGPAESYMETIFELASREAYGRYLLGTGVAHSVLDIFHLASEVSETPIEVDMGGVKGEIISQKTGQTIARFGVRDLPSRGHGVTADSTKILAQVPKNEWLSLRDTINRMMESSISRIR